MAKIERKLPHYLRPEDIEVLARQHTQLMAELWITKDRLAVLENMLENAGLIDRATFDNSEPDEALMKELDAEREAFIKRIMTIDPADRTIENLKSVAPSKE